MKKNLHTAIVVFLVLAVASCRQDSVRKADGTASFRFEEYTIEQLQQGYVNGDFTVTEVVQAYLDRIDAIDDAGPMLNAVIQVNPDAMTIAAQLDAELKEGKSRGPMHGVPVLLKDNIDTHDGMETTAGSRALRGSHPLKDSFVAQKLRESGAVILGKANLSEWANFRGNLSSSGWSGVGGQTKNPYILDRNPCGSSSGSGVAVSANLCMIAIGTETNGSIVCPSTATGIVGASVTILGIMVVGTMLGAGAARAQNVAPVISGARRGRKHGGDAHASNEDHRVPAHCHRRVRGRPRARREQSLSRQRAGLHRSHGLADHAERAWHAALRDVAHHSAGREEGDASDARWRRHGRYVLIPQ